MPTPQHVSSLPFLLLPAASLLLSLLLSSLPPKSSEGLFEVQPCLCHLSWGGTIIAHGPVCSQIHTHKLTTQTHRGTHSPVHTQRHSHTRRRPAFCSPSGTHSFSHTLAHTDHSQPTMEFQTLSLSLLEMKGIWQQHLFVSDFSSISLSGLLPVARSICTHRHTEHEGRHCTPSLSQMRGPQLQSSDLQGRLECQGWGGAVRDSRRWSKPETWQRALVLGHLKTHIQTK